jgi:hypothetical protein
MSNKQSFNYEHLCRRQLIDLITARQEFSIQEILYSIFRKEAMQNHTDISFILRIDAKALCRWIEKADGELEEE